MNSPRLKNAKDSEQKTWNYTLILTWILVPFVFAAILRLLNFLGS
ncbi:hypothetical protein ACFQY0_19855 [Haloferula chungangensis]|uniref:DUF2474 domain-containing protein n=1 Tax=Haloferula chungangensis TaxID=1048331 RepID=A0ABW2LCQ6_9BACT